MKNLKKVIISVFLLMILFGLGGNLSSPAMAATKTTATVTASPCKTKVTVNKKAKTFEAYTINGEDYYKLIDLAYVFKKTRCEFGFWEDELQDAVIINRDSDASIYIDSFKTAMAKGDGKKKSAKLVELNVYFNKILYHPTVYKIDKTDYYKLTEIMDLLNCGVIKNKKTGAVNFDTSKYYEPEFPAIPEGNAYYKKIQQQLYDTYFKCEGGKNEGAEDDAFVSADKVTVPDNATLYVPRGVQFQALNIFLGNNSKYVVRGRWFVEYPAKVLKPVSNKTKGTLYFNGNSGIPYLEEKSENVYGTGCPEVITVDNNLYDWIVLPIKSASISYGSTIDGIQQIKLNITRDKLDTFVGLKLKIHVKGGTSYDYYSAGARKYIDLMPLLVKTIGKNMGKNVTIDKIELQNANYSDEHDQVIWSDTYTIPVNWTINSTKEAPVYENMAVWYNDIEFRGLEKNSYIVKYSQGEEFSTYTKLTDYKLLSPENKYMLLPNLFTQEVVIRDHANIATLTGKKGTGKKDYTFIVSPFSKDITYAINYEYYPQNPSITEENGKTYLNFTVASATGEKTTGNHGTILVKYHKKGDAEGILQQLYLDDADFNPGKIDLTAALTALTNKSGSVSIDKLYVYGAEKDYTYDNLVFPSLQYSEVACDITTVATESVTLGKDTRAIVKANTSADTSSSTKATIKAKLTVNNDTTDDFTSLQLSPTGEKKWGKNLLSSTIDCLGGTGTISVTYTTDAPVFDIKVVNIIDESIVYKNCDLTGITAAGGKINIYSRFSDDYSVIVTNNNPTKPIKQGDYGTDTIDVTLVAGTTVDTFDAANFTLVKDDGIGTPYTEKDIKIVSLSQTTPGAAKLTFARYFDPDTEQDPYSNQLILYYKGYKVGKIVVTNY